MRHRPASEGASAALGCWNRDYFWKDFSWPLFVIRRQQFVTEPALDRVKARVSCAGSPGMIIAYIKLKVPTMRRDARTMMLGCYEKVAWVRVRVHRMNARGFTLLEL